MKPRSILIRAIPSVFLFLFLSGPCVFAQKSAAIDSFHYYVRNVQNANELMPLPENDPGYKEPEAELTLVIYIKDPAQLQSLSVDLGNQKDQRDIKGWDFEMTGQEESYSLERNKKFYPVKDGRIIITERVPLSVYTQKMYLGIQSTDKKGVKSGKTTKEFH